MPKGQTLGGMGEKEFLRRLLPTLHVDPRFINGFGDDSSAIRLDDDRSIVFKIDRAASPMASARGWTDYAMWGRLAVTTSCSDILAGGAEPLAVMIALVLPRSWSVDDAVAIVQGASEECRAHGVVFAGGDTKEGSEPQVVSSALGVANNQALLSRKGSQPGDVMVCAGLMGGFLASYVQLDASSQAGLTLDPDRLALVSNPRARWAEARWLRNQRGVVAAMDCSDGLYDAVETLTKGTGATIWVDRLPYHPFVSESSQQFGIPSIDMALGVGDWNMIYVVRKAAWEQISAQTPSTVTLTAIGQVGEADGIVFDDGAKRFRLRPVVNEHFVGRMEDCGSFLDRLRRPLDEDPQSSQRAAERT